jgi:hypothetical protein
MELYEKSAKPEDPVEFCRDFFSRGNGVDVKEILAENESLRERILTLQGQLEELEARAAQPRK